MADSARTSRRDDDSGARRASPEPALASVLSSAQSLAHETLGAVSDRLALLVLEFQRARWALMWIVALATMSALLVFTAWGLLWIGIVAGLASLGLHVVWAFLLAAAVNVLAASVAAWRARKRIPLLQLPATRRHLWPHQDDQVSTDDSSRRASTRSAESRAQ